MFVMPFELLVVVLKLYTWMHPIRRPFEPWWIAFFKYFPRLISSSTMQAWPFDTSKNWVDVREKKAILTHVIYIRAVDFPEEDFDKVIQVNLKAVWTMSQAAARHMIPKGQGKIISTASVLSYQASHDHGRVRERKERHADGFLIIGRSLCSIVFGIKRRSCDTYQGHGQ